LAIWQAGRTSSTPQMIALAMTCFACRLLENLTRGFIRVVLEDEEIAGTLSLIGNPGA
jgi:hypothetical protein